MRLGVKKEECKVEYNVDITSAYKAHMGRLGSLLVSFFLCSRARSLLDVLVSREVR